MPERFFSYSDLEQFHKCHRLFAMSEAYRAIATNEAIETGTIVHHAVSGYYRDTLWMVAIKEIVRSELDKAMLIANDNRRNEFTTAISNAAKTAIQMTADYVYHVEHVAEDRYGVKTVEGELRLPEHNIICHPDMISYYQGKLCVNDFKTGRSPDVKYLDLSGQCDFYALVYELIYKTPVELIAYDVIGSEAIYSHRREPRIASAKRIMTEVMSLLLVDMELALDSPSVSYDCPHCLYFAPCWLLETAGAAACKEYLENNYERRSNES